MTKLVVMCGVPGSGKSHFARFIENKMGKHTYIVSSDAIREKVLGSPQNFTNEKLCWELFYKLARVYSSDKEGIVILDATFLTTYFRTVSTACLKDLYDYKCLVVFELEKEIVYQQNKNRKWPVPIEALEEMMDEFEEPNFVDKQFYDDIFYVRDQHIDDLIDEIIKK